MSINRSDVSASACEQLNAMLREQGWRPSDAQVCELARMLADHVPPMSNLIREASAAT